MDEGLEYAAGDGPRKTLSVVGDGEHDSAVRVLANNDLDLGGTCGSRVRYELGDSLPGQRHLDRGVAAKMRRDFDIWGNAELASQVCAPYLFEGSGRLLPDAGIGEVEDPEKCVLQPFSRCLGDYQQIPSVIVECGVLGGELEGSGDSGERYAEFVSHRAQEPSEGVISLPLVCCVSDDDGPAGLTFCRVG